ncbi:cobalamin-binding protein [Thalassotalea litorea]|uniref:Cobalamin-binding protein n=1 Tax=Thalassotalea litorea TaxID=2020715 RepID=A0A5R9IHU3_9GAMM|nr:cobalamin-binding protein [Thalassotalea litorea]TLU64139.1 cobalamin-binding protein [Thalassotalea litorea]
MMKLAQQPMQLVMVMVILVVFSSISASAVAKSDDKPETIRIIALAPHIVEMLYAIDLGDNIIATLEHADYPQAAKAIPRVGNYAQLNIEQIVALEADVIIAWKTGNPDADIQRLKQLGQTVIYSHPQRLVDVANEIERFGDRFGNAGIAKAKADEFRHALEQLHKNYQDKTPVKVFYQLWPQPLTTVAGNAWPQQQLELCGAQNPFKNADNDYPQINIEDVLVANPELFIIPTSKHSNDALAITWQKYTKLDAVKHQQFSQTDADMLHRMTLRMPKELARLCQQIDKSRQYYQSIIDND